MNNKTDGIHDHLLPNTRLEFSLFDSKRDDATAMEGAFTLAQDVKQGCAADGGAAAGGVDAVIGPASSGPSINAQYVLRQFQVPQVGYSATSPALSDDTLFPYFVRLVPSDAYQAKVLAELIQHLGWKRVSTISGRYGIYSAGFDARWVTLRLHSQRQWPFARLLSVRDVRDVVWLLCVGSRRNTHLLPPHPLSTLPQTHTQNTHTLLPVPQ